MKTFFKMFFASLLAAVVFIVLSIIVFSAVIGALATPKQVSVTGKSVLVVDLSDAYQEQVQENPLAGIGSSDVYDKPGLYDVVRMIRYAKSDSSIKGVYIKCNGNPNGFATSEELRNALVDFKKSRKFVYAYGDVISEKAYYVANVADKIYCNPQGAMEWKGFAIEYTFFKRALDKLEIKPQIFYAGKFKSATEPFREEKMTGPNRVQSYELLSFLYNRLLLTTAAARGVDTASLHTYANNFTIRTARDAVQYKLIDAVKYDDEVQREIKSLLGQKQDEKISFTPMGKYAKAVSFKTGKDKGRIALIYAEGDIVDGKGDKGQIGGDTYRSWVRKARMDEDVKAIVFRVNSGGGSALASETIWRELQVARQSKPVIVSFGDVAASGGYYISCGADSIFAQPNTITGSIGVFTIIPDMQSFFNNKLGITFDGVKTADHADALTAVRPLNAAERVFMQNDVDTIYHTFLSRVAQGRKMTVPMVDSIGQGRVWMGERALGLGLVDKMGNLQDAVDCAARMAKLKDYRLKEYPEPQNLLEMLLGNYQKTEETKLKVIREEVGEEGYNLYLSLRKIKRSAGKAQASMPFDLQVR